jgi:Mg2+ and Co2+ transporter CorA
LESVLLIEGSAAAEQDRTVISEKLAALSELEAAVKEDLNRHIVEMRESIEKQNEVLGSHTVMLEKVSNDMQDVVGAVSVYLFCVRRCFPVLT